MECSVSECGNNARSIKSGICNKHYEQIRLGYSERRAASLTERFWPHVQKTDTCWLWTGVTKAEPDNYGVINNVGGRGGKNKRAHHVAWFLHFGSWPTQQLLHSCDVPRCVNPEHLREGTQKENMQDMAERTTALYCRHNVPRTSENTYIRSDGSRHCRCARKDVTT